MPAQIAPQEAAQGVLSRRTVAVIGASHDAANPRDNGLQSRINRRLPAVEGLAGNAHLSAWPQPVDATVPATANIQQMRVDTVVVPHA